jgi:hypothetical protein
MGGELANQVSILAFRARHLVERARDEKSSEKVQDLLIEIRECLDTISTLADQSASERPR